MLCLPRTTLRVGRGRLRRRARRVDRGRLQLSPTGRAPGSCNEHLKPTHTSAQEKTLMDEQYLSWMNSTSLRSTTTSVLFNSGGQPPPCCTACAHGVFLLIVRPSLLTAVVDPTTATASSPRWRLLPPHRPLSTGARPSQPANCSGQGETKVRLIVCKTEGLLEP